ncbi:MAG: single-stranded DNA-binding protein [Spirochaetales bacterium]|jgi:single-strand DNA-binding protein|nr:single-stranded DNA-binding protein [Spirochaetales bacterium]
MANDINMVVLVGRLTRDAELRYTNSGTAVCRFSLAVNRRKRSGDSWEDEAGFFNIVLWGKQGEALNTYLEKGKQIAVHGELRQNRWEQDGQKRSRIEVVANNVQLLGKPSEGGRQGSGLHGGGQRNNSQPQRSPRSDEVDSSASSNGSNDSAGYVGPEQFDDDIPF